MDNLFEKISTAMKELDEETLLECVKKVVDDGLDADRALAACQEGIVAVGELYDTGEYFVGDLIFSGDLMNEAVEILKPVLAQKSGNSIGKVLLCTVKDDIHDIGKNIVRSMLECAGLEVVDLGVDVASEKIVETAREQNIRIIALSCVLTLAIESMKATVDAFKAAGLRDNVKIIIGGGPTSAQYCAYVGADEWAHEVPKTVQTCVEWAKSL